MSNFDAGEIVAKLKLDRTQFNLDLDRAKADVEEKFGKAQEFDIKPVLDEKAVAEVLAEEEPLRKDIEPEVKPKYVKGEAESVGRTIAADILTGVGRSSVVPSSGGGSGFNGLLGALIGQGLNQKEIGSALKNLKFSGEEIKAAMESSLIRALGNGGSGDSLLATAIVHAILPSASEMDGAFSNGALALGPIGSTGKSDSGMALQIVESMLPAVPSMNTALTHYMRDWEGQMGKGGGGVRVATDFRAAFSKWLHAGSGDGGGGFIQTLLSGPGGPFAALSGGTGFMSVLFNPLGAAAGTAFAGAFGLAAAGILAGTAIGGAGSLFALLPGFLDLQKGMAAYTAITTPGGSTKGMSRGSIGLGKQIQGLMGAGGKGIHGAENMIMPEISKFIKALTGIIPLLDKFAKPAIKAMSGFFDAIDKGMGSKGFSTFMGSMTKLVGPIMKEFGKVILNLGTAFGGFLKLFGGVAAGKVGPWFVKITGELSHFLNHVKLGHGFVNGMVTVFSDIGKVLPGVVSSFVKLGVALAPIGLQFFRIVGWMGSWLTRIVKLVPPDLITAILGIVIALKGFAMVMGFINTILKAFDILAIITESDFFVMASPVVLFGLALLALMAIAYELHKHWKVIWDAVKRITLDAWHFLDNEVFHPIGDFFSKVFSDVLNTFSKLWSDIWNGIKTAVSDVWNFLKPIFETIKSAIKDITGAISDVTGLAGKVGGAVLNAIPGGSLVKSAVGAVTGAASTVAGWLGFRAQGGPVSAGSPYIVGEQGPELFIPTSSGSIAPNGGFGGRGQQIIFQIDARGHPNPTAVSTAVRSSIGTTIPALQAALARGAA